MFKWTYSFVHLTQHRNSILLQIAKTSKVCTITSFCVPTFTNNKHLSSKWDIIQYLIWEWFELDLNWVKLRLFASLSKILNKVTKVHIPRFWRTHKDVNKRQKFCIRWQSVIFNLVLWTQTTLISTYLKQCTIQNAQNHTNKLDFSLLTSMYARIFVRYSKSNEIKFVVINLKVTERHSRATFFTFIYLSVTCEYGDTKIIFLTKKYGSHFQPPAYQIGLSLISNFILISK